MAKKQTLLAKLATNLALIFLTLSVGFVCFYPTDAEAVSGENAVYRYGLSDSGVSLMFNVYWGEKEVYRILDTLDEYDGKATFFIGGSWADDNVDCLKEIYARGHEIGNHGYFHKSQDKLGLQQNREEIARCNQFISLAIGVTPTLFAPPSGAYSNATLTAVKQLKMKTILWSKDTIDWRDKNESLVYTRATKDVEAGALILMHPMEHTANALPDILKEYKRRGLTAITVGENLRIGE